MTEASESPLAKPNPLRLTAMSGSQIFISGITFAALILLIGTGSNSLLMVNEVAHGITTSKPIVAVSLILNIALVLLGWRRYRDLEEEVAERRQREEEARFLAEIDPLTGLYNRRAFYDYAAPKIARWRAEKRSIGVLVVDLDSFKNINDLFGHPEGDAALKTTAERMVQVLPAEHLAARIGGDEFAVVLPVPQSGCANLDHIGETLVAALSHPVELAGVDVPVSSSIGGAMDIDGSLDLSSLYKRADDAMYAAKGKGRCRYCAFTPAMAAAMAEREVLETALRKALLTGALYPVYEPLVDLKTGVAHGYEMLARWTTAEGEEIPPMVFIPIAEEAGLIGALTEQLMLRALRDALHWPAHIMLSINVSPVQLRDPWFAQKVLKALSETGYPGARLTVEITESALVDNLEMVRSTFFSLRNQGVRIALDDFGTGYSSIARLRELPFDSVKIDRDYVGKLAGKDSDASLAEAVLQLSHSLGLPVVAEGVEDEAMAAELSRLDCASAQGRLYGRSMTATEVSALYKDEDGKARASA
jgi:diguanylate cyclase (GGDEF)-like protein